jgi:hypothetical protein
MGKTWLADAVTGGAPRIMVIGGQVQRQDFVHAFAPRKIDPRILSQGDPAVIFADLLSGEDAPPFVILDNLEGVHELRSLLPANPTDSVVVATCRTKGQPASDVPHVVRVDKLQRHETTQLIQNLHPELSSDDAELIASTFDDYPLIIRYACRAFLNQSSSIGSFCAQLKTEAETEVDDVYTEEGASLAVALRHLIAPLVQRDPLAHELLICVSMSDHRLPIEFLTRYLQHADNKRSDWRCLQAVQTLLNVSLITQGQLVHPRVRKVVDMHPFVREILSQAYQDSEVEVCRLTLALCSEVVAAWRPSRRASRRRSGPSWKEVGELIHDSRGIFHRDWRVDSKVGPELYALYDEWEPFSMWDARSW